MLAVTTEEGYYINEGPLQWLGLLFCELPQTCQTNNTFHIFSTLIVLMPDQAEDTVILTSPHSCMHTFLNTQIPACLTTKQTEETHGEDEETKDEDVRSQLVKACKSVN